MRDPSISHYSSSKEYERNASDPSYLDSPLSFNHFNYFHSSSIAEDRRMRHPSISVVISSSNSTREMPVDASYPDSLVFVNHFLRLRQRRTVA
jgi:hypothetical protein